MEGVTRKATRERELFNDMALQRLSFSFPAGCCSFLTGIGNYKLETSAYSAEACSVQHFLDSGSGRVKVFGRQPFTRGAEPAVIRSIKLKETSLHGGRLISYVARSCFSGLALHEESTRFRR